MTPTIQSIVDMLIDGECTAQQALEWIGQYMENADLRDHFAGMAMQAAATNPKGADGFTFEQRAEWAYEQADAMLKARGQT